MNPDYNAFPSEEVLREKLFTKLKTEISRVGSMLPSIAVQGHYRDCMFPGGVAWWTNGFWPGILWQLYQTCLDETIKQYAVSSGHRIAEALQNPESLDHDVGFLFLPSAGAEYLITGAEEARETLLSAAEILAGRFREKGQYLEAWNEGSNGITNNGNCLIADSMMNISLLYRATEITGDQKYKETADKHAHTTLKYIVREDGSANHIVRISPEDGMPFDIPAGQGYAPGSSWTRGQGWVLYGFANAYMHTGSHEYLEASRRSADYILAELEKTDYLPKVDFRAPLDDGRYDTIGGMVIASGLLTLASCCEKTDQEKYEAAARKLLFAVTDKFADWNTETDGILYGCSTRYHNDRMDNLPNVYADYFYLEAVLKLRKEELKIW